MKKQPLKFARGFQMDLYRIGDAIEGASCELYSRRPDSKGVLVKHPFSGKLCMRVEMSRNSTSEISKELELSPDELALREGVYLNLGDKLIADAITVYVCQRRPVKFEVEGGLTHTHKGQVSTTKAPAYCKIKYSHEHIGNALAQRFPAEIPQI